MIESLLQSLDTLLLLFFVVAALAGGVGMLLMPQPMRVAMALIVTMISLAAVYGLLGVHFIAAFQVLIYVGAVMVFMVYAIMLLEQRRDATPRYSALLWPGILGGLAVLGALLVSIWRALPSPTLDTGTQAFGVSTFSVAFLADYWLHFELTSVLLVAAVVAAIAVLRVGRSKPHG